MFYTLLFQPLVNGLIFFYKLFGNLGLAIILFTLVIRLILFPLTIPSLKAGKKIQALAPEMEKLKKKYGKDKQRFFQAQLRLYQKHKINPAAGCLPQIIQLVVLIALYQAFMKILLPNGDVIEKLNEILYPPLRLIKGTVINTKFLYLDLTKPDIFHLSGIPFPLPGLFLLGAALIQFLSSKISQPMVDISQQEAKKTPGFQDDMMAAMQTQMLYLFPLMTILIGYSFPSGLVLYWLIFSLVNTLQQYLIIGFRGEKVAEKNNEKPKKGTN